MPVRPQRQHAPLRISRRPGAPRQQDAARARAPCRIPRAAPVLPAGASKRACLPGPTHAAGTSGAAGSESTGEQRVRMRAADSSWRCAAESRGATARGEQQQQLGTLVCVPGSAASETRAGSALPPPPAPVRRPHRRAALARLAAQARSQLPLAAASVRHPALGAQARSRVACSGRQQRSHGLRWKESGPPAARARRGPDDAAPARRAAWRAKLALARSSRQSGRCAARSRSAWETAPAGLMHERRCMAHLPRLASLAAEASDAALAAARRCMRRVPACVAGTCWRGKAALRQRETGLRGSAGEKGLLVLLGCERCMLLRPAAAPHVSAGSAAQQAAGTAHAAPHGGIGPMAGAVPAAQLPLPRPCPPPARSRSWLTPY